jgi:hypothetical protein
MQLTFLQGDKPLTKKYTRKNDGGYEIESYPSIFRVTSHEESVHTVEEFAEALKKHAELGNCLHTGSLDRSLTNESRKGHHDKDEKREWVVLDLDGLSAFNGVEQFLAEMPEPFQTTSYIVQHSPSSGIKPGLRAHVFFLLDAPVDMTDVKSWVMEANLVTEKLRNEITLTAKDFGLSYPLDRIANDNGRIVFITAPECVGFEDPLTDRVRIIEKDGDRLAFDFRGNIADIKREERKHIDQLRTAKGLKKRKHADYYETRGDLDVLKRDITESGRIHPVRQDNELIIRCNLDDGDSEAYFYYIEFPTLLRNHKGEPCLFMEAVDKKYYNEVALPAAKAIWEKDVQPFVIKDKFDDKYYVGSRKGDEIVSQPHKTGSHIKITAWYRQVKASMVPPDEDEIETWEMKFNPTYDHQWNPDDRVFNTYRKTDIMRNATFRSIPPKTINRIIAHALGNGEEEYHRFINWLAYVYQTRKKTGTAWILHGCQGTGKGLLVDHILTPIFGNDYVVKQQARDLRASFNGFIERAIFVNLDEFDVHDTGKDQDSVMAALKSWVTDPKLSLRKMHADHHMIENFSNFIITTNSQTTVPVPPGERRMNYGVRQEKRLEITAEEIREIAAELEHFAGYLHGYEVDHNQVHQSLENEAKAIATVMSRTSIDEFALALHDGDLFYFIEAEHPNQWDLSKNYSMLLKRMIDDAKNDRPSVLDMSDLAYAYRTATGIDSPKGRVKKMLEHKNIRLSRPRLSGGARKYILEVKWNLSSEDKVELGVHLQPVGTIESDDEKELQTPQSPPTIE